MTTETSIEPSIPIVASVELPPPLRIDIGCGPNPKPGFLGVDLIQFGGNIVCDLRPGRDLFGEPARWPWADNSVDEVHCSHFLEHLTNLNDKWERVHFFNELWRVMKVGAKCALIFPHWASNRYYGDPTHKEPFSEMGFYYLNSQWRDQNAPHTDIKNFYNGYACHFEATWGYGMLPAIAVRPIEFQQFAMQYYKEACTDIVATLVKAQMPTL